MYYDVSGTILYIYTLFYYNIINCNIICNVKSSLKAIYYKSSFVFDCNYHNSYYLLVITYIVW